MRAIALSLMTTFIVGCAGKLDYVRPIVQPGASSNSKVIDKPRDAVWNASVPALGRQFFVINNLDKSSGLINVSYSGDPEKYVDCGQVSSYVKNLQGEARRFRPMGGANRRSCCGRGRREGLEEIPQGWCEQYLAVGELADAHIKCDKT